MQELLIEHSTSQSAKVVLEDIHSQSAGGELKKGGNNEQSYNKKKHLGTLGLKEVEDEIAEAMVESSGEVADSW